MVPLPFANEFDQIMLMFMFLSKEHFLICYNFLFWCWFDIGRGPFNNYVDKILSTYLLNDPLDKITYEKQELLHTQIEEQN